jgi:hypothetical protein
VRRRRSVVAAVSLLAGALVAIGLGIDAFRPSRVANVGWDAPGYVVQMRAASRAILDLDGGRPGTAVVGAFASGIGAVPVEAAPIVLSLALVASLGAAAAAWLRRAVGTLPAWGLGVTLLVVAGWGGTGRLAAGYLANLLALVLFTGAAAVALGAAPSWPAVAALLTASLLAHPGLLPAIAGIVLGWIVVDLAVDRRRAFWGRASLAAGAALAVASASTALVTFGVLGLAPSDLEDLALARGRFDERAAELLAWVDPALTLSMVVVGGLVAFARRPRPSADAVRLTAAWLTVAVAGLAVLAIAPGIPGHRTLLLAVPAPILGALALVGAADRIGGRGRAVAALAATAAALAVTLVAMRPFDARAGADTRALGRAPGAVAAYLAAVDAEGPVVLVLEPSGDRGLLAWKARQQAVRAVAPDDVFLEIVVYVGDERELLAGRATHREGTGAATFELVSSRTWERVRPVLARDPVVLAARPWVEPSAWARLAAAFPVVGPDLAVLRGPVPSTVPAPVPAPSLPAGEAALRVVAVLLLLAGAGSGWSAALAGGALEDRLALAPVFGAAAIALAGLAVAIAGADPGGPWGWAAVGVAAPAGWLARAWTVRPVAPADLAGRRG